jgi:hypothetical protein
MPQPEIDRLEKGSNDAQTKAAISACIAHEVRNGKEQDQAVAMCYAIARKASGQELAPKEKGKGV